MIWIFLFTLLVIISYCSKEAVCKERYRIFMVILIIIISYIVAFGGKVCIDNESYAIFYKSLKLSDIKDNDIAFTKTFNNRYEIGFLLLNYFGKIIYLGVAGFFFLIALFVNGVFVNFIYKYKNSVLTVMYLVLSGICIQQGNLVRQFIAAAIFTYSIKFLLDKKWLKYLLCVILAAAFHTSSLLLLLFVPLCFIDVEHKGWYKYTLFALYGISLLAMLGRLSLPLLEYASIFVSYDDYLTDVNNIGMEFSIMRLLLFNGMAIFVLMTQVQNSPILTSILVMETIVTNLSVPLPNIARLYVLYDVVSISFFFHSLYINKRDSVTKWMLGTSIKFVFIIYLFFLLTRDYMLNDNVLLLSKTYSFSELFNF